MSPDAEEVPSRPLVARPRLMLALVLLATVLTYLPALPGEFVWDDVNLIRENPMVRDPSRFWEAVTHDFWYVPSTLEGNNALARRYYRPVVTGAYALEFRAFGDNPLGYHLVNLALHLACTGLAYGWLRRRLATTPASETTQGLGAVLGAALFALHPSRAESVAWISGSTDLWLGLFVLLGLRAWDRVPGLRGGALTAFFFAWATLSKEVALMAPALLLIDPFVTGGWRGLRAVLPRWAVSVSGSVLAIVLRSLVVSAALPKSVRDAWWLTHLRVLSSVGHYAREIFAPWPPTSQGAILRYVHNLPVYPTWSVVVGAVVLLAVAALAWRARRDPAWRPWLADVLWMGVALFPTLNLVPMGLSALVASRFLYLPLLGVCALLARVVCVEGRTALAARASALAVVVASGAVSSWHAGHFVDEQTLWSHEVAVNPRNHYAWLPLARVALRRNDGPEVERCLARAYESAAYYGAGDEVVRIVLMSAEYYLRVTPDDDTATLHAVRVFYDDFLHREEGVAQLNLPRLRASVPLFRRELAMRRSLPVEAARGWSHFRDDDMEGAERILRAEATRRHAYSARRYLAQVLAARMQWDEAAALLRATLRELPNDQESARLLERIAWYRAGLAQAPDAVARQSLEGRLWADLSRSQRARVLAGPLAEANPTRVEPVATLVYAEMIDRRADAARAVVARAVARAPSQAAAFRALLQ